MKKIILTLILGLLAATAVGFWYFKGADTSLEGTSEVSIPLPSDQEVKSTNPELLKGKNSIMSLVGLGKSMECTFVFSGEGVRGEGTGFFDKGLARIDSLYSGSSTEAMSSYMIIDSSAKVMYTWFTVDGKTQGIKMSTEQTPSPTPVPPVNRVDINKQTQVTPESDVQYDCKPWRADTSVFVPPANIKFMDMTDMQKQMEDMKKSMGAMKLPAR